MRLSSLTANFSPASLPNQAPAFGFDKHVHSWIVQAAVTEFLSRDPDRKSPLAKLLALPDSQARLILATGKTDERSHKPGYPVRPAHHFLNPDHGQAHTAPKMTWQAFERAFTPPRFPQQREYKSWLDPKAKHNQEGPNLYTGLLSATDMALMRLRRLASLPVETVTLWEQSPKKLKKTFRTLGDACHLLADMHSPPHVTRYQPDICSFSLHRHLEVQANKGLPLTQPYSKAIVVEDPLANLKQWMHGIVVHSYEANAAIAGILGKTFEALRGHGRRGASAIRGEEEGDESFGQLKARERAGHKGRRRSPARNAKPPQAFFDATPQLQGVMTQRVDRAIAETVRYFEWLDRRLGPPRGKPRRKKK